MIAPSALQVARLTRQIRQLCYGDALISGSYRLEYICPSPEEGEPETDEVVGHPYYVLLELVQEGLFVEWDVWRRVGVCRVNAPSQLPRVQRRLVGALLRRGVRNALVVPYGALTAPEANRWRLPALAG